MLVVPWVETIEVEEKNDKGVVDSQGEAGRRGGALDVLRGEDDVNGTLKPSTRRLGLHEVRVYELDGKSTAMFRIEIPADVDPNLPRKIGRPWLSYSIADVRGLAGSPRLRIDGKEVVLEQGVGSRDLGGVHARLDAPIAGSRLVFDAQFDFALGGTESLAIAPLAKRNRICLIPHASPQFNGAFCHGRGR